MSAATMVAIHAQQQAHEAHIVACKAFVQGFTNDTATVTQTQEYAECIALLHPQPMPDGGILLIKIAIVIVLLSIPIGAWWGSKDWSVGLVGGAVVGVVISISSLLVLFLITIGIIFLFH